MDLSTAIPASTAIVVFGTGLFAFLWKYTFGENAKKNGNSVMANIQRKTLDIERREYDNKWRQDLTERVTRLETNQDHLKEFITNLKQDIHEDMTKLEGKIDMLIQRK